MSGYLGERVVAAEVRCAELQHERDEARVLATEAAQMLGEILASSRLTITTRASLLCSADELAKRIAQRALDDEWDTFGDLIDSDG